MKKLLIILITIPLIFNSCKKEDDSPNSGSNNTSGSILGTWEISSSEHNGNSGYIEPVLGTEIVTETWTENFSFDTDTIGQYYRVFRYDNTGTDYIYNSDTLSHSKDFTYVKDENMLNLIFPSWNLDYQITTLTDNYLNVVSENTYQDGDDTTYFQIFTYITRLIKSELPSITTEPLNKKKPVNGYNSFLNRRENR